MLKAIQLPIQKYVLIYKTNSISKNKTFSIFFQVKNKKENATLSFKRYIKKL